MSLKHVLKAEKLGRCQEDSAALASLEGLDLSDIRSDAGCNMLFVYLIKRWTQLFEPGPKTILEENEDFHDRVIAAYLRAGCSVDDAVASNKIDKHTPPSFKYQVKLSGKLSPLTFLKFLQRELHPDMFPAAYQQLSRLIERLASGAATAAESLPAAPQAEALAQIWRGVRLAEPFDAAKLESEAKGVGLGLVVAGDLTNLPKDGHREAVLGLCLHSASSEEGRALPLSVQDLQDLSDDQRKYLAGLGPIADHLVASGPLATAILARGVPGGPEPRGAGQFIVGADMRQDAHPQGVWGEVVAKISAGVRRCELSGEGLFLLARYD